MTLRIPDTVLTMNRADAFMYYREHLHLSDADAHALVAESHGGAFRDLTPTDDDQARIAAEIARHPQQSRAPRTMRRDHDTAITNEAPALRTRVTAHGHEG